MITKTPIYTDPINIQIVPAEISVVAVKKANVSKCNKRSKRVDSRLYLYKCNGYIKAKRKLIGIKYKQAYAALSIFIYPTNIEFVAKHTQVQKSI